LTEVLSSLGVDNPILVGHSDGASISLIHAGAGKWPVRGVVAMAPHVFVERLTVESIAQAKVTFETTDLAQKLGRYHDDPVSTFRGWNDIWLNPDFLHWNIESYLPGITCPVLLIQGEDDQYGTLAQIHAIERQVRGTVERAILPNCGHSPHVDQKEATLEAIAEFVKRQ
jgi:pimeloyl-ACP methyl ester carboxylesterase